MRRTLGRTMLALGVICWVAKSAWAATSEEHSPVRLSLDLREEFTDNRDNAGTDAPAPIGNGLKQEKDSTFDTYVTPRIALGLDMERTLIDFHYAPSLLYRSNPNESEKKTQLWHDLGFDIQHSPTPGVKLHARDAFTYRNQPATGEGSSAVPNASYFYNAVEAGVDYQLTPRSEADVYARDSIRRYRDSDVAATNDLGEVDAGLVLWRKFTPSVGGKAVGQYTAYDYKSIMTEVGSRDRNFKVGMGGLGVGINFTPNFRGDAVVGGEFASYDDAQGGNQSEPYGELTLRGAALPVLRIQAALVHGIGPNESTYVFASRTFTSLDGRIEWDTSDAVTLGFSGGVSLGEYKNDTLPQGVTGIDGTGNDTATGAAIDAKFKIAAKSSVTIGQRFEDVSSDVRPDYTKDTTSVALNVTF